MNEKQQQLTFDKGITNVPSDALCSDNALEESLGMIYDDGEHRVIQKPVEFITSAVGLDGTTAITISLLYVHKFNNEERYIVAQPTTIQQQTYYVLIWGIKDGTTFKQKGTLNRGQASTYYTDVTRFSTIGKTLIVADATSMHYYLWAYDSEHSNYPTYEYLGDAFPKPDIQFKLGDAESVSSYVRRDGIIYYDDPRYRITGGDAGKDKWNDAIIGQYLDLRKQISQKKKFQGSFCVRAALELYDGTYFHISNPVFMLNIFSAYGIANIAGEMPPFTTMEVYGQNLYYKHITDYTKWSDIIKNVVLFVTEEAKLFDTTVDALLIPGSYEDSKKRFYYMNNNGILASSKTTQTSDESGVSYYVLESIPDSDLIDTIKSGVYYKLCEIGTIGADEWKNAGEHFNTHTLENITTQPQLGEDDYYSHCPIKAGLLYSYNSRLNIANVSRGFFSGFDNFMPFDNSTESSYRFLVTIQTDGGQIVVEHTTASTKQKQGIYFYYPDARAKHVDIFKGNTQILHQDLTEHPNLNGAYYFAGVSPTMVEPSSATSHEPTVSDNPMELLPNYVIQSEVNNPFVFKAAGYFKVGTGRIIGMSTITQALSEGQFGQFPLLVFSESGIWSLSVASTGYYDSAHPMSREVALINNPCITQTDGAVFFASEKGLMVVIGSNVKCVSQQLSGKTRGSENDMSCSFLEYLKNSKTAIAYDYRDSLLWIINPNRSSNNALMWIYSLKTGVFAKYESNVIYKRVINTYPDALIQSDNTIYSLIKRVDINSDNSNYTGTIITRPMKLENALALKSIMQIRHILQFNPYTIIETTEDSETHRTITTETTQKGTMTLRIFASNNLYNWVELHSLRGTPWKYYRFRYDFSNLIATDRFSGTMLITQERRTNKLR